MKPEVVVVVVVSVAVVVVVVVVVVIGATRGKGRSFRRRRNVLPLSRQRGKAMKGNRKRGQNKEKGQDKLEGWGGDKEMRDGGGGRERCRT